MKTNESPTTDKSVNSSSKSFWAGAITGGIITLISAIILQFQLNQGWELADLPSEIFFGLIGALIFGAPAGGVGGLILGKIWKVKIAGVIGGVLVGLVIPSCIFGLLVLFLGGG